MPAIQASALEQMFEAWCPEGGVRESAVHLRNSGHVEKVVIGDQAAQGRVRGRRNASSGFNVRIKFTRPASFTCRCGKVKPTKSRTSLRPSGPACEHVGALLLAVIGRLKEEEQTGGVDGAVRADKGGEDYAPEVFQFLHDLFPGIGPKRAKAVARVFRTVPDLLGATPSQLRKLPDIGMGMADVLHKELQRHQRLDRARPNGRRNEDDDGAPAVDVLPEEAPWLVELADAADDGRPSPLGERRPLDGRIIQVQMTTAGPVFFRPVQTRDPALRHAFKVIRRHDREAMRTSRRHRLWVSDRDHFPRVIGQLEALGARRENIKLAELPLAGLTFFTDTRGARARFLTQPPGVEVAYPMALRILEDVEGHEVEDHTGQHLIPLDGYHRAAEALTDLGALLIRKRLRPMREITEWDADDPADQAPGVPYIRPEVDFQHFLEEPLPEGLKPTVELRPYQREGVAFIRWSDYRAYVGDPPGLGKTIQALTAALYLPGRVLVVCPAGARNVWKSEIKQHTTASAYIARPPIREKPKDEKFIVGSYEAILNHEDKLPLDEIELVILDEAHYVKNKDALRTQAVHEKLSHIPKRILLSGTPVMNRTEEVRKQLEFIHPDEWANEVWFRNRFVAPLQWGTKEVRLAALRKLREYFRGVMLRRQKEDVLKDLPPRHVVVDYVDIPEDFRAAYDDEAGMLRDYILSNRETAFGRDYETTRGRVMRLKRLASEGKRDAARAKARHVLSTPGEKVVIFAYYLDHIHGLMEDLAAFNPVCIHGGVADKARQKAVKAFQTDPDTRVFIGQLTAAGTAITLTAARHSIFVDLDWNPANHQQAMDRIHRISQTREVFIHQLVADGTIEDTIVDLLQKKSTMTAALLDADEDSPGLLPVQRENQMVARLALEVAMGRHGGRQTAQAAAESATEGSARRA